VEAVEVEPSRGSDLAHVATDRPDGEGRATLVTEQVAARRLTLGTRPVRAGAFALGDLDGPSLAHDLDHIAADVDVALGPALEPFALQQAGYVERGLRDAPQAIAAAVRTKNAVLVRIDGDVLPLERGNLSAAQPTAKSDPHQGLEGLVLDRA